MVEFGMEQGDLEGVHSVVTRNVPQNPSQMNGCDTSDEEPQPCCSKTVVASVYSSATDIDALD